MKFVNFGVANGLYRFYDSIYTKGIYNMTENIENTNTDIKTEMTVGEILRNARTTGRRKREIPTISKQLCIREEFLQALEDGNYSVIPENVYILGFARNYAMELGLDPDEIVGKLKREMGLDAECMDEEKNDVAACAIPDNRDKWYNELWMRMVKFLRRYWIWVLGGLVLLVVLVGGVIFINSIGTADAPDVPMTETVVTTDSVVEPQYNTDVRERFGTENRENASVILQATQESWVKVEDRRGNTMFSRVLVPGDVYYVPSGDSYSATFGNAGGVDVWVNGKLAPAQGADHARVSGISLSPEKLMPVAAGE